MDRASDYGSEGWGFESLRAHTVLRQYLRKPADFRGFSCLWGSRVPSDSAGFTSDCRSDGFEARAVRFRVITRMVSGECRVDQRHVGALMCAPTCAPVGTSPRARRRPGRPGVRPNGAVGLSRSRVSRVIASKHVCKPASSETVRRAGHSCIAGSKCEEHGLLAVIGAVNDRLSSGTTLLAKHAHTPGSGGPPHRWSLIVGAEGHWVRSTRTRVCGLLHDIPAIMRARRDCRAPSFFAKAAKTLDARPGAFEVAVPVW